MSMSIGDSLLLGVFGLSVVFAVLVGLGLLVRLQSALVARLTRPKPVAAVTGELHEESFVDAVPAAHHIPEENMTDAAPEQAAEAPEPESAAEMPPADAPVWGARRAGPHHGSRHSDAAEEDGSVTVSAPAPGKVLELKVAPGAAVRRGQILLVLDAMNMECEIEAPRDGTVTQVLTSNGASVDSGTPLVKLQ